MNYLKTGAWLTLISAVGYIIIGSFGISISKSGNSCDIQAGGRVPDECMNSVTWNTPGLIAYSIIILIAFIGILFLFTAVLNFIIKKIKHK
jgi:protein-S-isoprenylcysteine O-methyltransferase Ste14